MNIPEADAIRGSAGSASRAIGAMFFSVFGGGWLAFGLLGGYGTRPGPLLIIIAGTAVLSFFALRQFRRNREAYAAHADSPESKRAGRIFGAVNAVQWALIFGVAVVLSRTGHKEWTIPSIIFIIGIHFFPLAAAFRASAARHCPP